MITLVCIYVQVTGDGRIVSEGTARRNVARKELESRTKDLLADVIVSNALEIEVQYVHFAAALYIIV